MKGGFTLKKNIIIIVMAVVIVFLLIFVCVKFTNNRNNEVENNNISISDNSISTETNKETINNDVSSENILKGKDIFEKLCTSINQKYDEHTFSRISDKETIYELVNKKYSITISADKITDKAYTIRLVTFDKSKQLYYAVADLPFTGVKKEDIITFLDGSLGGAGVYSPSGYNFLINLDKEANPILDVSIQ